jgi:hypothetical protein
MSCRRSDRRCRLSKIRPRGRRPCLPGRQCALLPLLFAAFFSDGLLAPCCGSAWRCCCCRAPLASPRRRPMSGFSAIPRRCKSSGARSRQRHCWGRPHHQQWSTRRPSISISSTRIVRSTTRRPAATTRSSCAAMSARMSTQRRRMSRPRSRWIPATRCASRCTTNCRPTRAVSRWTKTPTSRTASTAPTCIRTDCG